MTPAHQFKFAFLSKCAQDGLTPEQTRDRACRLRDMVKAGLGLSDVTNAIVQTGVWGHAIPLGLGAAVGASLGSMDTSDPDEPERLQRQETIEEYNRQTRMLEEAQKLRDSQAKLREASRRSLY